MLKLKNLPFTSNIGYFDTSELEGDVLIIQRPPTMIVIDGNEDVDNFISIKLFRRAIHGSLSFGSERPTSPTGINHSGLLPTLTLSRLIDSDLLGVSRLF
ncbi:hypothetical protein EVAR_49766_1 [Eumeta japonica]|uniref:Uncharacterized protein n=1 Tax=Eumeta variegata TaxID=151549 RepID=A0A4C1Y564_EUMVA|nr:hypothetical protein EVAR_49766_1 [Eumeta japonica]